MCQESKLKGKILTGFGVLYWENQIIVHPVCLHCALQESSRKQKKSSFERSLDKVVLNLDFADICPAEEGAQTLAK